MFVEVQISSSAFLRNFQRQLRARLPCIPNEFLWTWPAAILGAPDETVLSLIDHVSVGTSGLINVTGRGKEEPIEAYRSKSITTRSGASEWVPGCSLRITQTVTLHIAKVQEILAAGAAPLQPAKYFKQDLAIVFEVDAYMTAPTFSGLTFGGVAAVPDDPGTPRLFVRCLEIVGPASPLVDQVKAAINANRISEVINLPDDLKKFLFVRESDPDALKAKALARARVINVGVSDDGNASAVAIRMEIGVGDYDNARSWSRFFQVGAPDTLRKGEDWSVRVDGPAFLDRMAEQFEDRLDADGRMRVTYGATATMQNTPIIELWPGLYPVPVHPGVSALIRCSAALSKVCDIGVDIEAQAPSSEGHSAVSMELSSAPLSASWPASWA